jgi:hypothetical protein
VVFRLMDGHIEDAKMELTKIEKRVVDMFCPDKVVDELIGDLFRRLGNFRLTALRLTLGMFFPGIIVFLRKIGVVFAQGFQLRGRPAPILEHLARSLHEVSDGAGTMEAGVCCLRDKIMDTVSQLME